VSKQTTKTLEMIKVSKLQERRLVTGVQHTRAEYGERLVLPGEPSPFDAGGMEEQ